MTTSSYNIQRQIRYYLTLMRLRGERLTHVLEHYPEYWDSLEPALAVMTGYSPSAEMVRWLLDLYECLLRDLIRRHDEINKVLLAVRGGEQHPMLKQVILCARQLAMQCGNDCWRLVYTLRRNPEVVQRNERQA